MKLEVGKKIEDFGYCTQNGCKDSFIENLKADKTILLFLRYIGCTVCNLAILEIRDNYEKLKAKGTEVFVVLQSDLDILKEEIKDENIPFEIIVDPEMELYEKFSLDVAKNKLRLIGKGTIGRISQAKKMGLKHGKYEGNELQLPATFVMDREGNIIYAKYGTHLTDSMPISEMLKL